MADGFGYHGDGRDLPRAQRHSHDPLLDHEVVPAPSEAVDEGTPLADVDTTSLVVARAPFCDAVDPAAVARALGEEPAEGSAYRSGQRIKLSDGTRGGATDVVHEFGCRWTAGDGVAEAWVFVPPITRERAADLVRACFEDPLAVLGSIAPLTWPTAVRLPEDHWTSYPVASGG